MIHLLEQMFTHSQLQNTDESLARANVYSQPVKRIQMSHLLEQMFTHSQLQNTDDSLARANVYSQPVTGYR